MKFISRGYTTELLQERSLKSDKHKWSGVLSNRRERLFSDLDMAKARTQQARESTMKAPSNGQDNEIRAEVAMTEPAKPPAPFLWLQRHNVINTLSHPLTLTHSLTPTHARTSR